MRRKPPGMQKEKTSVSLSAQARELLAEMASQDLRSQSSMMEVLIRQEAERRGIMSREEK